MVEHRTAECHCLSCGEILDALSHPDHDALPEEGCITVCAYCRHIMALNADFTVRELTDAEMIDVAGNAELLAVQRLLDEFEQWKREEKEERKT